MTRILLFVALGLVFMTSTQVQADDPQPGKQVAQETELSVDGKSRTISYWVFVPENYAEQDAWPLMLFLHGAGERGHDLEAVKQWGPPRLVQDRKDFPFVVVSPQCPSEQRWDPDLLAQLVDHVAGQLKVDKSRMYVTGLSMGGYGTWALLGEYPNLFAAAVPICGGGDPSKAERYTHVPVWAFHGDADSVVPVEQSRQMVSALKEAGADARLTEYQGVEHNSWSPTYENEEVYQWLLKHRRKGQ